MVVICYSRIKDTFIFLTKELRQVSESLSLPFSPSVALSNHGVTQSFHGVTLS